MRRKPKDIPQLKPHDKPKKPEQPSVRRRGLIPSQDRFSVQNIKDVTTPQGVAMLNEELRRLRPDKPPEPSVEDRVGVGEVQKISPTLPDTSASATKWALTVKHNTTIQGVPKEIQGLDFRDRDIFRSKLLPVIFRIKAETLEQQLIEGISSGTNRQVVIEADAQFPIISGVIPINRLPSSIADTPNQRDYWKRSGYHIRPDKGHYGWAVYNYIDHGWHLDNPNDFILNIVDLHQLYVREGLTELEVQSVADYVTNNAVSGTEQEQRRWILDYFRMADDEGNSNNFYANDKSFEPQVFLPVVEGKRIVELDDNNLEVTKDIIILRGMYKPNNDFYWGGEEFTPIPDMVETGIIRTNIVFYYTLIRK